MWEDEYAEKPETLGTQRRKAAPTCFWEERSWSRALVHGEDNVGVGPKDGADRVKRNMKKWYEVKARAVFGRDADGDQDIAGFMPDGTLWEGRSRGEGR